MSLFQGFLNSLLLRTSLQTKPQSLSIESSVPKVSEFTKDDYTRLAKSSRKKFVHDHFSCELNQIFDELEKDSVQSEKEECYKQVRFLVPHHFDTTITEQKLKLYFVDLGYKAFVEEREGRNVVITLS